MDLALSFNNARYFCEKEGADLASIEFGGENDFMQSRLSLAAPPADGSVTSAHIGLYYDDWWNRWHWVDGLRLSYKDWVDGAPTPEWKPAKGQTKADKPEEKYCGAITADGWKDVACATQLPFICKKWEKEDMMRGGMKNRKWRSSAVTLAGSMIAFINVASMFV
jgi:hypothetical protein